VLVKRSRIIVASAALALSLAAPGVAHAGWSWGDDSPPAVESGTPAPAPDGWSWGEESSQPAPDGWTWGEE
jgi:hypothetical protein